MSNQSQAGTWVTWVAFGNERTEVLFNTAAAAHPVMQAY
jgi:hypothetical protein